MRRVTLPGPIALLLALAACPLLALAAAQAWESWQIVRGSRSAVGTVVANQYAPDSDGGGSYLPVVTFEPPDSQPITFTDGVGSLPPDYPVGSRVTVLSTPSSPRAARIGDWKRLWLVPTLLAIVGALPLIVAALLRRMPRI